MQMMWRHSVKWRRIVAQRSIRCHCNKMLTSRPFSKDASYPESAEHCSKTLSWMGEQLAVDGEALASEWAHKLSPSARKELSQIQTEAKQVTRRHTQIPEPPRRELRLVALSQAIPFVGFGIMDNAILIVAGDAIDTSLGVILGISTMCAAAIGNIISDVAGIMLGTIIEDFSSRLGLPAPNVSAAQRTLRSVRFASQFGCGVGIVVGCIIGMFPLLLIDSNKVQKMKQEAHMDSIFRDVVTEAKGLVGAQATRMFLVVDTPDSKMPSALTLEEGGDQYLYGKYVTSSDMAKETRIKLGRGIVSRAVLTGEAVNVYDAQTEPDFAKELWEADSIRRASVKNMVCVPVFDSTGRVIAVIQAVNKLENENNKDDTGRRGGFTEGDVQLLKVLASHLSVSLQSMYEDDAEVSLRDTMKVLKEHGLAGLMDEVIGQGRIPHRKLFPDAS